MVSPPRSINSISFRGSYDFILYVVGNTVNNPPPPPTHTLSLFSSSDYGFKPVDGFNGPCVLDEAVPLDDPCADGQVKTVMKSRGYRKVAGDVCIVGAAGLDFEPYEFTCCSGGSNSPSPGAIVVNNNKPLVTGLGVTLAIVILVTVLLGAVAAIFVW